MSQRTIPTPTTTTTRPEEGDDEEEGKDNRGYLVDQRTSVTHLTNQKGFELRTCLAKLKGDADSCLQDTFVRYFVA